MKARLFKFNYLRIITLLILSYNISFAQDSDSLQATPRDTTLSETVDSTENSYSYYLIGGAGFSGGPSITSMMYPFDSSPAINLGIELPITYNHIFSLELKGFWWIAKSKYKLDEQDQNYFINLSNDFYSLMWLSAVVKCYFSDNTDKFRISIHLGYLFLCSNKRISGLDFGLGVNYTLDDLNYLNITYSGCIDRLPMAPMTYGYLPTLFMLNYCHKFNW